MYDFLIFDLDGTISDPKTGIVRSINYALEHHGFDPRSETDITPYIGPPLDRTFILLAQSEEQSLISSLVSKFRERYAAVGFSENTLYEGVRQSLHALHETKLCRMGICTSKRADFAGKILELFGLQDLFMFVSGGDMGIDKWQQLEKLLSDKTITQNSIMIGDRYIDLTAARKNRLPSAGVLWGYGSKEELEKEKPEYLFEQPAQLSVLIT